LIGEREYFGPFTEILENEFRKRKIDQVRITESPFSAPYQLNSFKPLIVKCSLLDLERFDQDKIWEGYREEIRRAIRKAQRKGLYVKRATSRNEVKVFYGLYLSSMERNRAAAKYPLQWFYALYEILTQRGIVDILKLHFIFDRGLGHFKHFRVDCHLCPERVGGEGRSFSLPSLIYNGDFGWSDHFHSRSYLDDSY
jgi:hypothetical protein